jgi:hypothetical protein
MRQLTIAASAVAIAALIAASVAPASADYLAGAPRKRADGMCWKGSRGSEGFGIWRPCPQPAKLVNGRDQNGKKRGEPGFIDPDHSTGGGAYSGG